MCAVRWLRVRNMVAHRNITRVHPVICLRPGKAEYGARMHAEDEADARAVAAQTVAAALPQMACERGCRAA